MIPRLGDAACMSRALFLAERGAGRTSPNPMVGAVVVDPDGVVVGSGYHERAGEPHAEVYALRQAAAGARGATLYCTLEPCCHTGRTGPCAERVVEAGVRRVVASLEDPNPLVRGGGFEYLRAHGVAVDVGVGRAEALRMNAAFLTYVRERRPYVTMKVALSLDAFVAAAPGVRTAITSPGADRHVHEERARTDAVGVGAETVVVDDPLLTVRGIYRERPLARVVFDRRLSTPPRCRLLSTLDAGPVIIMTSEAAVRKSPERVEALYTAGARVETAPDGDVSAAMSRLGTLGITSLVLEGGPRIHRAAWRAGVVDRVHIYVSPRVLGGAGVRWLDMSECSLSALHEVRAELAGEDVFIEGHVHRID